MINHQLDAFDFVLRDIAALFGNGQNLHGRIVIYALLVIEGIGHGCGGKTGQFANLLDINLHALSTPIKRQLLPAG